MDKKPKITTSPISQAEQDEETIGILKMEYASLLDLYIHTENATNGIFNFYLTLLSAVTGAIIVLFQVNSGNLLLSYPSIVGLLVFAVLIGIITQDSIVNRNIDLSNFTLGLNLLKYRLFRDRESEKPYISYIDNFFAEVSPIPPRKTNFIEKIHKKLWWIYPLGTHQLFIGIVNGLALTGLMIIAVQIVSKSTVPVSNLTVGGIVVFFVSFQVHCIYARIKHRLGIERFNTAANTQVPWLKKAG